MSAHEDFSREHNVRGSSNRTFGITLAIVFAVIAFLPLRHRGDPIWWCLALGCAFLFFASAAPRALRPVNAGWTWIGLMLGRITTPVITAVLFYLLITPLGWMLRAAGKDPMRLKYDPAANSYWLPRTPPGPAPETMTHQF